ncbi:hypothetical protein [Polyangium sp. 6x1]|uniref:hypothetical protein n=1 Tax=Polyangium sp. 6x1 TaxID=3042689 RepID=UPI0024821149|nr:hypothetical protein [Polyangium sp. 6x1]MDI1448223.1 hypothetical protein [Polyangium sp. 6x1]
MIARRTKFPRALGSLLVLALAAGCGGGPALRAAEQGDLGGARRALASDPAQDAVDEGEARRIARVVLEQEVKAAKGDAGVSKLKELPSCAEGLDDVLEARAAGSDEVAAIAALIRFDARLWDRDDLAAAARAALASKGASGAWRAVEARGLVAYADGAQRRSLFAHGDQAVRLAALKASFDAFDPNDTEALLEAARLDPHPPARLQAIDAVGNLGGERVVLALKDLFVKADEDERVAIVGAWASSRALDAGGRAQLARVAQVERGLPQIAAAAVLVRQPGPGAEDAAGVLARSIEVGSTRERVFAIHAATLDTPSVREALVKARGDTDEDVAIAALGRGLEMAPAEGEGAKPKERAEITQKLLGIAKGKGMRALLAKAALARAGAREVLPLLTEDARSKSEQARKVAGTSLVALGELGRAALLAVDADPRVRTGVACAMLRAK